MNALFQKWGNSLAVRIPSSLVKELGVSPGKAAEIQVRDNALVVTPVPQPVYTLDELLAGITPENIHGEYRTATAVGEEFS